VQAFLTDFASSTRFQETKYLEMLIEDSFFSAAVEVGEELESYSDRIADEDDPDQERDLSRFSLHRFFGMHVVHWTQYGEGEDNYGPFANGSEAKAIYHRLVFSNTRH
jgi:hypothetical protein